MPQSHPEKVFADLDGQTFPDYDVFLKALLKKFKEYRSEFPFDYTYRNLIGWGENKNWIVKKENGNGKRKEIIIQYNSHYEKPNESSGV